MSYSGVDDKDLDLKLCMMNYFWKIGNFPRPSIPLHRYRKGKRTSKLFTDIDVLAIQFLPLSEPLVTVCSAKSGKESDPAQLFWLAGVMNYFGASRGYYVRTKASIESIRQLSKRLNILSLNEEQFKILESNLDIESSDIPFMFTKECYKETNDFFNQVKNIKRSIYNYLTERYWIDPPNYRLMRTYSCAQDLFRLNLPNDCKLFMRYYCASLFSVPLVHLLNLMISTPDNLMKERLETELMGGEIAQVEKTKILHSVELLMKDFARYMNAIKSVPSRFFDFSNLLKIEYLNDLLDLILRFKQRFKEAIFVPQILDVIAFEVVLRQEPPSFDTIFDHLPKLTAIQKNNAAKLSKDVLVFFERNRIFKRKEIEPILKILPET